MLLFPLTLVLWKFSLVRYGVPILAVFFQIFFLSQSSDAITYSSLYSNNRDGRFISDFEPLYQYLSFLFSKVPVFGSTVDTFLFSITCLLLFWIYKKIEKKFFVKDLYFVFCLIVLYVVTYQVADNYRTGVATLAFLVAIFSQNNVNRIVLLLACPFVHIQTLPAVILMIISNVRLGVIVCSGAMGSFLFWIFSDFFYIFVWEQLIRYLETYSGSFRVSGLVYLLIYFFVLYVRPAQFDQRLMRLLWFGAFINCIFFDNSFLASRITRVIDPILMIGLYFSLSHIVPKLDRGVRFLITIVPGMSFYFISFLIEF